MTRAQSSKVANIGLWLEMEKFLFTDVYEATDRGGITVQQVMPRSQAETMFLGTTDLPQSDH